MVFTVFKVNKDDNLERKLIVFILIIWLYSVYLQDLLEIQTQRRLTYFKFTSYLHQNKQSKHFYEKVIHCDGVHLQSY